MTDTPDAQPVRRDLIDEQPFTRRVYVRTPPTSHHLTVWHVRRWVDALNEAGIPDDAMVNSRKAIDTLHLVELSAHREDVQ
jgi:hypothetical protein